MTYIPLIALIFIISISYVSGSNESSPSIAEESISNFNYRADSVKDILIFAHVITRHGDRNIDFICPNDPHKHEEFWAGGYGQLTHEGKRRHFKLGQYLRKRYKTIIGDKYSPYKVFVQSTDYERTIASVLTNLAGLFYPSDEEKWDENIPWQPVPVHTIPMKFDFIFHGSKACPKYNAAFSLYLKESGELQRIYAENADQFQFWTKKCGTNITTMNDVLGLFKTLNMEHEQNKALDDWAKTAIERGGSMEYIAVLSYKVQTDTTQLARLFSGFLIKEMLDRFSMKINSTLLPDRSLWIYSAHEASIIGVLNSLGLFQTLHLPPYASSLHFELYKNSDNEHYVQLFYKKFDEENLQPLNIPKCGEKCSLDKFYELFSEIIPGDFHSECNGT